MKSKSTGARAGALRSLIPYFVLGFALLLTGAVTCAAATAAETRDRLRFEAAVHQVNGAIETRMETYIAMLLSGKGLFAASEEVTREKFHAFVAGLGVQVRYPGIREIGYSARVRPGERDALVARMQGELLEGFTLHPDHEQAERHAILYLEPPAPRRNAATGYDMSSDPVRRAAMERARDTGAPAASGRVTLVEGREAGKHTGFILYVPVYRNGAPHGTAAERAAALQGFVYSPFRADDLLNEILAERVPTIDVQIYDGDGTAAGSLLHASADASGSPPPRLRAVSAVEVAGRMWTVVAATRPEFDEGSTRGMVPCVLLGGVLVSGLLFGVTRSQAEARALAERSAADLMTSERSLRAREQERLRLDEEIIRMQAARLAELSTPLIPLNRDIVLMPLIGTLDAPRAQQVLEAVAHGVSSRRSRFAILDITGVATVDTQVASLLLRTAQVVRLLGAELVLTGINPSVARTIVELGIDLGPIITRSDLQRGITYAAGRPL